MFGCRTAAEDVMSVMDERGCASIGKVLMALTVDLLAFIHYRIAVAFASSITHHVLPEHIKTPLDLQHMCK